MLQAIKLRMRPRQKQALKALVGFFAFMLVFTLLSRGLDSFTVAQVAASRPVYGSVVHKTTVEGIVNPSKEEAFTLPEGFPVKELAVKEGQQVKSGDLLAVLDIEAVSKQLTQTRRDLQDAQLQLAEGNIQKKEVPADTVADAEASLKRAEEDFVRARKTAENDLEWAERELRDAQQERRRLDKDDSEDGDIEAAKKEVLQMAREVDKAEQALERAIIDGERSVEDAKKAVENAKLKLQEDDAQKEVDSMARDYSGRRTGLTVAQHSENVAKLEALLAAEGKIYADAEGTLTSCNIKAGDVTGSGGAFILSGQEDGCVFKGVIAENDSKHLAIGDKAEIYVGTKKVIGQITGLTPTEDRTGCTVTAIFPTADISSGTPITLHHERQGAEGRMVPLTALYSDGGDKTGYVYILREKNTTMGIQTVVERFNVGITDKNTEKAVVEAPFAPEDEVVSSSSRVLTNGDRVRVEASQ